MTTSHHYFSNIMYSLVVESPVISSVNHMLEAAEVVRLERRGGSVISELGRFLWRTTINMLRVAPAASRSSSSHYILRLWLPSALRRTHCSLPKLWISPRSSTTSRSAAPAVSSSTSSGSSPAYPQPHIETPNPTQKAHSIAS